MTKTTSLPFIPRAVTSHSTKFSPLSLPPFQIELAMIEGDFHRIPLRSIYSQGCRCRYPHVSSEGSAQDGVERFVYVFRPRPIHLIPRRPRNCLPELPTVHSAFPNSIKFMVPQTGPTPPPSPPTRRPRGERMRTPTSLIEGGSRIRCGWAGCGARLPYDLLAITGHINRVHKVKSSKMICGWEKPDGEPCGTGVHSDNLKKHTLDLHTTLIVGWCKYCGSEQRIDVMPRHENSCDYRRDT